MKSEVKESIAVEMEKITLVPPLTFLLARRWTGRSTTKEFYYDELCGRLDG